MSVSQRRESTLDQKDVHKKKKPDRTGSTNQQPSSPTARDREDASFDEFPIIEFDQNYSSGPALSLVRRK